MNNLKAVVDELTEDEKNLLKEQYRDDAEVVKNLLFIFMKKRIKDKKGIGLGIREGYKIVSISDPVLLFTLLLS